jgi:outer membrane protein OmpA-like peptidoglycan-associated protein
MTRRALRLLAVPVLAVMAVGAASSCSAPRTGAIPSRPEAAQQPATSARAAAGLSIAQLDHGRQARFVTCAPPACPVVTPKTLAVDPPRAAAAEARADSTAGSHAVIAQSLSPGETLVIAGPQAPLPPAQRNAIRPQDTGEPLVSDVVVSFPFGSAVLTAASRALIDAAATGDGIRRIDIRGRTDNVGPAAANDRLARQRAAAVAQYLRARHPHLADAELNVDGRGVCCYATENDTPEGRARNRRVEIAFWRVSSDL